MESLRSRPVCRLWAGYGGRRQSLQPPLWGPGGLPAQDGAESLAEEVHLLLRVVVVGGDPKCAFDPLLVEVEDGAGAALGGRVDPPVAEGLHELDRIPACD